MTCLGVMARQAGQVAFLEDEALSSADATVPVTATGSCIPASSLLYPSVFQRQLILPLPMRSYLLDLPEETSDFIELPRGCQCWEMAFLIKLLKF
jgi:hypothetical protein